MSRTSIAFALFGGLALVGIVGMLIQRARAAAARRLERRTPIPLVIPVTRGGPAPTPWRPRPTPAQGNGYESSFAPPVAAVPDPAAAVAAARPPGIATPSNGAGATSAGADGAGTGAPYAPAAGAARRPPPATSEGTLQLLPGRFEVVGGMDGGRDIRFVRGPGGVPEVTLGRGEGPMYRHVQLPAQTVSRMHARMRFENGRWHIANLSPTNPVVINGEPLVADGASRPLAEGDRVELGEVVLRFRERA